jgi:hypothetical protein
MFKSLLRTIGIVCVMSGLGLSPSWAAESNVLTDGTAQCKALGNADFSGVQDAPAQVTETKLIKASADRAILPKRRILSPLMTISALSETPHDGA